MSTITKKIISMLIVFVMIFTYTGGTLEAVATTDGISAITNGFFGSEEMNFNAYFEKDGNQNADNVSDVNDKTILTFELSPKEIGKGFLKEGSIFARGADGSDINFRFVKIKNVIVDDPEETVIEETNNGTSEEKLESENNDGSEENTVEETNIVEESTTEKNNSEKDVIIEENTTNEQDVVENTSTEKEEIENVVENEIQNETEENIVSSENEVTIKNGLNTGIENQTTENENTQITSRSSEPRGAEETAINDELINEEEVIENVTVEAEETYEELTAKDFEIEIVNDNQIKIQNVIYNTKIEVEIEYDQKDVLDISDLYKEINLQLDGKYINLNLEKIQVETNKKVIVGWNYHKEIDVSSEYTQVSPFQLGEHSGTIIESRVILKRETEEKNYLPIKQTTLEIDVPEYNGNLPETVNVQSTKLMATRGEDLGEVTFGQENWNYDSQNKKIIINVTNEKDGKAQNSIGEDEYTIVYRYNDYTENEKVTMDTNVKVVVEEYNSNDNIITTKEIHNSQEITTQINNLITYNIGTTQTELNKAKINANYNSDQALYEAEYTSTVNVNILTSDVLEELKINSSKELYLDSNQTEFDATNDVYYNKVKFNHSEIKNILQNGASIEIQTLSGELLYTLTDDSVQNEDSCEVRLASKEKGIYVIFKNIAVNGNISIEFTKAIGKSNYDKAAFSNFKKIKSCVSAELKYKSYDELYGMPEICATKDLAESRTVAEINLTNNNLTTMAKNDSVEVRIALNNDKQDSDLYINPSFELVFPRYVKNVTVQNINLLYACGLRISDYQTYLENDLVKIKVELEGIQNTFSESVITDGTNIVLNLNIELDEYTPRKQDQIKMYYCNEGVTNYESQTKWTISKPVPNGILKQTNGFDVAVVNYQAPNGFITSNAIINYDGQASKVKSIDQGEKTVEIKANNNAQISTMELVAMNNTGNTCTEVALIGRIPFAENKSVITGKNLGTTATAKMLNAINENIQNVNMTTIYYSSNENATKDLKDSSNGWVTEVSDWSQIKSYMIVVKGEIKAGTVLKYTYDFEIPGSLGYDKAIYGSFGGFYNNQYETVTSYESTEADKVGIVTEKEPEVKVTVAPYVEKQDIYYGQTITIVTEVKNNMSENLENSVVKVSVPTGTVYTEKNTDGTYSDYAQTTLKEFTINNLKSGEKQEFLFDVRVLDNNSEESELSGYGEVNGFVYNYKWTARKGKLNVEAMLADADEKYFEGSEVSYIINLNKQTDDKLKDLMLEFKLPTGMEVNQIKLYDEGMYKDLTYKDISYTTSDAGVTTAKIGTIDNNRKLEIICTVAEASAGISSVETTFAVYESANTNKKYISNMVEIEIERLEVEVTQYISGTDFNYNDTFDYSVIVENKSDLEEYISIDVNLPDNLFLRQVKMIVNGEEEELNAYNEFSRIERLLVGGKIEIIASGEVMDWGNMNEDLDLSSVATVSYGSDYEVKSNEINVKVHKYEEAPKEILEEKEDDNNEEDDYYEDEYDEEIDQDEESEQDIEKIGKYSISGKTWVDSNRDSIRNEDEVEAPKQVQVQLLKGSSMIKATTTDSEGNYSFSDLESGDYSVVFNYDQNEYTPTAYIEQQTENESKAFEIEEGKAVTDTITITDKSIENIDTGLQEKDKFDLEMKQYISKAIINVNGEEKEYDYEDLELAKLEIKPSDLKKATVKIVYKLVVENVGNVDGQVTSIVDYVPNGLIFNEAENKEWSCGVINGNIYYDGLKGVNIAPGESQEITLVLNKKMTEDNTGVISNKAKIAYTESATRLTEGKENNFATQETIVTVTQGANGTVAITITLSMLVIVSIFAYMVQSGKIQISLNLGKGIKKVYK